MRKIVIIFFFITFLITQPLFSQNNNLNMSIGSNSTSGNTLESYQNLKSHNEHNIYFNLGYSKGNLSSQLYLNFDENNKFSLDNSFTNYRLGIANFNIGKINRVWSFSEQSSLILSSNARPLKAISIKLENKFDTQWLSSNANWSVEIINGETKNSYNGKNSMFLGKRLILTPMKNLHFEFLQSSQWGGENKNINSSLIRALTFGDTNIGRNSEINKMAGFGVSYLISKNENSFRMYGQAIGEDEAGNLPSCYSWMAGLELIISKLKFPTTVAIEAIDTRVDTTLNGFCGPNTMYNNAYYNYINYNTVLGVPIDTEGTSIEFFGKSKINKNLNINYSAKLLTINNNDYLSHRLSSERNSGSVATVGMNWKKNNLKIGGNIIFQNLSLDKAKVKNGATLKLTSSISF